MSYYSTVKGRIEISPPLKWKEFKDSPFYSSNDLGNVCEIVLNVEEEVVEIAEGMLVVKRAVAIIPAESEPYQARNITAQLEDLLALHGEGHDFIGYLEGQGERDDDLWRLVVIDGRATKGLWSDRGYLATGSRLLESC